MIVRDSALVDSLCARRILVSFYDGSPARSTQCGVTSDADSRAAAVHTHPPVSQHCPLPSPLLVATQSARCWRRRGGRDSAQEVKAGRRGGLDTAQEVKARDGRCSHSSARVSHRPPPPPPLDGPGERAQRVWRRITESQRARSSEHGGCSGVGSQRAQGSERGVWGGMLLCPIGLGAASTACGAASGPSGPRGASEASGETPWWSVHGAGGEGSWQRKSARCWRCRGG